MTHLTMTSVMLALGRVRLGIVRRQYRESLGLAVT